MSNNFNKPFFLGITSSLLIVISFVYLLNEFNFAPAFAANHSFNAKAQFLRRSFNSCDLIVLGSSMALNNIDGEFLENSTGHKVINFSFWGASPSDSLLLYKKIRGDCTPKILLLPLQYQDFSASWSTENSTDEFYAYIKNRDQLKIIRTYVKKLMPTIANHMSRHLGVHMEHLDYKSLAYDQTGSVMFDCEEFRRNSDRWNGFKRIIGDVRPEKIGYELNALAILLKLANLDGVTVFVLRPPLREVAELSLNQSVNSPMWEYTSKISKQYSARFLYINNSGEYSDDEFADFSHLNKCGARKLTLAISKDIQ